VFGSLLLLAFSLLGEFRGLTLTLAGVTGVIVSIGITSDSYIVFFERIKEEARLGRTIPDAVDEGFQKAFRTILTADFVSFMGAALLWALSVGAVKGFALALGIATMLDVVVAYFFTRNFVGAVSRSSLAEKGAFSIRAATGTSGASA
jgi:preprotein translocase subunit SecD